MCLAFSADQAALNTHITQMMNIINLEMGMATAVRGGAIEAYEQHLAPYTVALDAHIIGLQAASAQWEFSIAEQEMQEAREAREAQQQQRKRGGFFRFLGGIITTVAGVALTATGVGAGIGAAVATGGLGILGEGLGDM